MTNPASLTIDQFIQQLIGVLDKLSTKDRDFAESLIRGYKKYDSLSAKQEQWVQTLINRATHPQQDKPPAASLGDFSKMYNLFMVAKASGLKFPKLRLQIDAETPVVLAMSGPNSKVPNSINVNNGEKFGNPKNRWYGRISKSGAWTQPYNAYPELPAVADLLKQMGDDPAATAEKYGKMTGYCCFCGLKLTDEKSTAAGYGPVCAKNWGLGEAYNSGKSLFSTLIEKSEAANDADTDDNPFPTTTDPVVKPSNYASMSPGQKAAWTKKFKAAQLQLA